MRLFGAVLGVAITLALAGGLASRSLG